ncbi:hypothetical protein QQF64_011874, partial [Cirrhinus molitorella]
NSPAGILGWILRWILGLPCTSFNEEPAAQDKVKKGFRKVKSKGFQVITQSGSGNTSPLHHRDSRTHS